MKERSLYPEIERSIENLGGYWKKTTDMHFMNPIGQVARKQENSTPVKPKKGDADFVWVFNKTGRGAIVEVKHAASNFNFAEIKPEQRDLLTQFENIAWLWLSMGTRLGANILPRKAWLIPWKNYLRIEAGFQAAGLAGMAHTEPHSLMHRATGMCAAQALSAYELISLRRDDKTLWGFDPLHPLWKLAQDNIRWLVQPEKELV